MFDSSRRSKNRILFHRNDGLNFRRRRRKLDVDRIKKVSLLLLELALAIFLGYLTVASFGRQVECSNESMEPTYAAGDRLLVNRVSYRISSPKSGDVIAFKPRSNVNASYSIKRVIAVPGDTIYIENGRIYVNDEIYKDSVSTDTIDNAGIASSPITVGENQYFVLGDNRTASEDSRYESIGLVSDQDILGKIWARYPF